MHILKYLIIMFIGGLATSFAEYTFSYSLYETVSGLVGKLITKLKGKS